MDKELEELKVVIRKIGFMFNANIDRVNRYYELKCKYNIVYNLDIVIKDNSYRYRLEKFDLNTNDYEDCKVTKDINEFKEYLREKFKYEIRQNTIKKLLNEDKDIR